jgi:hypothetical protein
MQLNCNKLLPGWWNLTIAVVSVYCIKTTWKLGFAWIHLFLLDPVKCILTNDVKAKQIQIRNVTFSPELRNNGNPSVVLPIKTLAVWSCYFKCHFDLKMVQFVNVYQCTRPIFSYRGEVRFRVGVDHSLLVKYLLKTTKFLLREILKNK